MSRPTTSSDCSQEVTFQRGIAEMIQAGYLADVRGVRVGLEAVDLDAVAQSGGDYDAEALGDALEQAAAPRHVLAAYQQHAAGRKAAVFVPTVALAHTVAGVFSDAGIATEALDATTPIEHRRGILDRLRTGETQVVVNVGVLSEGWDEPSLECIVIATPTRSQASEYVDLDTENTEDGSDYSRTRRGGGRSPSRPESRRIVPGSESRPLGHADRPAEYPWARVRSICAHRRLGR